MPIFTTLVVLSTLFQGAICFADQFASIVKTTTSGNLITLQNEFVQLTFDQQLGGIVSLSADFHGKSEYGSNLLVTPFQLDVVPYGSATLSSKYDSNSQRSFNVKKVTESGQDKLVLEVQTTNDFYSQDWTISLASDSRVFDLKVSGKALQSIQNINHASYSFSLLTPSLYGLFADSGVAQMMNQQGSCMGTHDELSRAYFLGGGGALDLVFEEDQTPELVFHSNPDSSSGSIGKSGLEFVIGGQYPNVNKTLDGAWSTNCWTNAQRSHLLANSSWTLSMQLMPNNFNFPVYALSSVAASAPNLPFTDLATFLTGLYASPAGCLQSYYTDQKGIIAPTVSHPDVGYSPDSNFFDPDNFISLSALMYSGDSYFLSQTRDVIERTAETMCGIGSNQDHDYCDQSRQRQHHAYYSTQRHRNLATSNAKMAGNARSGQLMHHFISLVPTYESIAGSEQLGPNIFWTLSVLRYASLTQDKAWAQKMFPYVDLSAKFILSFVDTSNFLVNAPGE